MNFGIPLSKFEEWVLREVFTIYSDTIGGLVNERMFASKVPFHTRWKHAYGNLIVPFSEIGFILGSRFISKDTEFDKESQLIIKNASGEDRKHPIIVFSIALWQEVVSNNEAVSSCNNFTRQLRAFFESQGMLVSVNN